MKLNGPTQLIQIKAFGMSLKDILPIHYPALGVKTASTHWANCPYLEPNFSYHNFYQSDIVPTCTQNGTDAYTMAVVYQADYCVQLQLL